MKTTAYICDVCDCLNTDDYFVAVSVGSPDLFNYNYEFDFVINKNEKYDIHICLECINKQVHHHNAKTDRSTEEGEETYKKIYEERKKAVCNIAYLHNRNRKK